MSKFGSRIVALGFFLVLCAFAPVAGFGQKAQPSPTPASVNVVNTPDVVVGNTADSPVPVRVVTEPARQHFQVGGHVLWQCGQQSSEHSYEVPAGKRFVIEHAAFRTIAGALEAGVGIRAEVWTTFEGTLRARPLDFNRQQFGQSPLYVAAHPLLAYADGGTSVTVRFFLSDPASVSCSQLSTAMLHGILTGHLVDAP